MRAEQGTSAPTPAAQWLEPMKQAIDDALQVCLLSVARAPCSTALPARHEPCVMMCSERWVCMRLQVLREAVEARLEHCKGKQGAGTLMQWLCTPANPSCIGPEELWSWEPRLDAAEVLRGLVEEQCSILACILSRLDKVQGMLRKVDTSMFA